MDGEILRQRAPQRGRSQPRSDSAGDMFTSTSPQLRHPSVPGRLRNHSYYTVDWATAHASKMYANRMAVTLLDTTGSVPVIKKARPPLNSLRTLATAVRSTSDSLHFSAIYLRLLAYRVHSFRVEHANNAASITQIDGYCSSGGVECTIVART